MYNLDKLPIIRKSLVKIAVILNEHNINWGLGGSLLLYLKGIKTSVADIDIVIDPLDISKLDNMVLKLEHTEKQKNEIYLTERFYCIVIGEIDIDLMAGFKVKSKSNIYDYPSGTDLIDKTIYIDKVSINIYESCELYVCSYISISICLYFLYIM